ncbi:hypothetical protein [Cohnella sp. REN36]|uniref:hypothetical protein n=1 Tax=Cohnella sp. REN36 TaxID=2887347 RepID=UPI001D14CF42|nr:hypothetical protein [Cohnella sp. REN36]MCC3377226.1 hypothetical protein [Cohnella sp. REN36]
MICLEIDAHLPSRARVGLPASLADTGLDQVFERRLQALPERTVAGDASNHLMPGGVAADQAYQSFRRLEAFAASRRSTKGDPT